MKYRAERHRITKDQLELLTGDGKWQINDIPRSEWIGLPEWMSKGCVGVMASGSMDQSRISHGLEAIGGIDWLRSETQPREGEPEGNAYHYVITEVKGHYYLHGPFLDGTLVPHWFTSNDLENYEL